jgi:hypothetical protein
LNCRELTQGLRGLAALVFNSAGVNFGWSAGRVKSIKSTGFWGKDVGGHPCFWAKNGGKKVKGKKAKKLHARFSSKNRDRFFGNVRQSWKKWYKGGRNMRKVGEWRANKLEKVFEKCESLEGKMGNLGGMEDCWARGGGIALWVVVQR